MSVKEDARGPVLRAALAEVRRRGDRRLGTEHLLLGLLHDPKAVAALGIDLAAAHQALEDMDRAALAAIGLDVSDLKLTGRLPVGRRPPATSGIRAALLRAIKESGRRRPTYEHLVLAVISCERPDPAAELLAQLGVNPVEVRTRLRAATGSG